MLATASPSSWDILALQEPWFDHLGNSRANSKWNVIYPSPRGNNKSHPPRSIILISTRFPSETITQIPVASNDITAIKIQTPNHTITIINIYNANDNNDSLDTLRDLWEAQENVLRPTPNTKLLLLGDFNRHHSAWEGHANAHLTSPDRLLNPLLDAVVNMRLEMTLPKGIPTLEARHGGRWTRPDNVWRNADSSSTVLSCEVHAELRPSNTDHLPIVTTLDLNYYPSQDTTRFNFRLVDWEVFRKTVQTRIDSSTTLSEISIQTTNEIEDAVDELFQILQDATKEHVPAVKPLPHLKRWWTKELTTKRKERNRASKEHFKWRGLPDHPSHEEYRRVTRTFAKEIDDAKSTHWREWIEQVKGDDVWKVNKYMNASPTDFGCQRIPHLNRPDGTKTSTGNDKAERLAEVFFPSPKEPPDMMPDFTERATPPAPPTDFTIFTTERVMQVLRNLNPFKAPGQSGIPNSALKNCAEDLAPVLAKIYTAICELDYYPLKFRNINQVVIRKPGRPSYEEANAYRPIALIETLAKVQSTIITEDLTLICESHNLLPANQFGGRPGRTTNEALHLTEQFIKSAWRKGDVVSALFLDIQAAFPNMQKEGLLKNMRARNINEGFCKYVNLILTHRQIRLVFDDVTSQPCNPTGGCNQGCPLSMLLYIIYNAPLVNIANPKDKRECIIGFVDDTTLLAQGKTFKEAHQTIKSMMERDNGVFNWSRTYSSPLEMNKLALVNFSHSTAKVTDAEDLLLTQHTPAGTTNHQIKAKPHAKLLGVILDSKLNWTTQHEKVREKATKFTAAFKRYTKMASGIRPAEALRLYNAVAVPRICYASDIWYKPLHRKRPQAKYQGSVKLTKQLESIQRQAAISITGAMRTTAGDSAIVHANIKPIALQLKESAQKAYARLATRPNSHPLTPALKKTHKKPVLRHRSALHRLATACTFDFPNVEKVTPARARPHTSSPYTFRIASTKKDSIIWDKTNFTKGTMIYTDGSCRENIVGASAVMYVNGIETDLLRYQLGPASEHMVFEGELVGILLGTHLARAHMRLRDTVNFSLNSQEAIGAIQSSTRQSAQYLIDEVHRSLADLHQEELRRLRRQPNISQQDMVNDSTISLTWVAGHMKSEGNENADAEAKTAAVDGSSSLNRLPPFLHHQLPISISAIKKGISKDIKMQTKAWWSSSPRFTKMNAIDPSLPSDEFLKILSSLNRRQTSLLTQLRTGHAPLNKHLHTIQKSPTPNCPQPTCASAIEDIHHLIFTCPRYIHARYHLTRYIGRKDFTLSNLLANKDTIDHTLTYLNSIGRFKNIFGDIAPVQER